MENFAPDRVLDDFEARVRHLFETKWLIDIIDSALVRLKEYPVHGQCYYTIIQYSYLSRDKHSNEEIMRKVERFRKNYLLKIREIEKQIITKQKTIEELKEKIKDKGSFVSDIIPNVEEGTLNRLSLVSFIDHIEIGEDNAINFVFNNMETVNLRQAILDSEKCKNQASDENKVRVSVQ